MNCTKEGQSSRDYIHCLIYWIPMRHYQATLDLPLHSHYRERWTDKHTRSSAPVHLLLHCRSWGMGSINTYTHWKCVKWLHINIICKYFALLSLFFAHFHKGALLFRGMLDPIWQMSKLVWKVQAIINNNLSLVQHSRWSRFDQFLVISTGHFPFFGPLKAPLFNSMLTETF